MDIKNKKYVRAIPVWGGACSSDGRYGKYSKNFWLFYLNHYLFFKNVSFYLNLILWAMLTQQENLFQFMEKPPIQSPIKCVLSVDFVILRMRWAAVLKISLPKSLSSIFLARASIFLFIASSGDISSPGFGGWGPIILSSSEEDSWLLKKIDYTVSFRFRKFLRTAS